LRSMSDATVVVDGSKHEIACGSVVEGGTSSASVHGTKDKYRGPPSEGGLRTDKTDCFDDQKDGTRAIESTGDGGKHLAHSDKVEIDSNVMGEAPELNVSFLHRVRQSLGDWLTPRQKTVYGNSIVCCYLQHIVLHACEYLGAQVAPKSDVARSAMLIGIANGDLRSAGQPTTAPSAGAEIRVKLTKRTGYKGTRKQNHRHFSINVLAERVMYQTRIRLGNIELTPDNKKLVRADVSRRAEGLRRDGDPEFKNLRDRDLYRVVSIASEIYWILTDDEMDLAEAMNDPLVKNRVSLYRKHAKHPLAC